MKKVFVFLLSVISAALVGFIPIKADEITTNYEDINTVTPVLTPQEIKEYDTALYLTEYLRQGGYVDFSHVNNNYSLDDFVDDFTDSLDSLITGQRYSTKELMAMETSINLTNLGLDIFTNIYRNNLISYDETTNPIPTPPTDYSYIAEDVDFIPFTSGVLSGIKFISSDLACSLSYPSPGYPSYLDNTNKSNYTYYNANNFGTGTTFYLSSIVNINIVDYNGSYMVTYGNFNPQYIYYNTQNIYSLIEHMNPK